MPRRHQTKDDGRADGHHHGVTDRAPVEPPRHVIRHLIGRHRCRQQLCTGPGDREAERHTEQAKHRAFCQQLADDAAAARTKGRTHGDFAAAHRRACEQQVCGVGTRDEQHKGRRAHHQPQDQRHIRRQMVGPQIQYVPLPAFVGRRVVRGQSGRHRAHVVGRLHDGGTGRESAVHPQASVITRFVVGQRCQRHPELSVVRKLEALRHHADDLVGLAVEEHASAQDGRTGLISNCPEFVAEDHHAGRTRHVIAGGKRASQCRVDPEHREEVPGHRPGSIPVGFPLVGQRHAAAGGGRHGREACLLLGQVAQVEPGKPLTFLA